MFFINKDDSISYKYNKVWNKIKTLITKFHSMPAYDEKYIKVKVKKFIAVIKANFLGGEMPKKGGDYTCKACISVDSVMRMEKKNYAQVYLEECNYKTKKIKMSEFIGVELESDSSSDSE